MAQSDTQICNLALAHLGIANGIASLTERSNEARLCNSFYDTALREVLRDFPWSGARRHAALALVEASPTTEWAYAYRYPSDALFVRRLFSGARTDSRQSRVEYAMAADSAGKLILTDSQEVVCEYTVFVDAVERFDSDFVLALSYRLAVLLAPALTGGDPFKLGNNAMGMYRYLIAVAQANAANEEQPAQEPESEFVRAR